YITAIAIKERAIGPQSYEPEKFKDPVVLDLIEKITIEYDPSIGRKGITDITTKDGRQFQKRIETPHGLGDDPLTDTELEDKFREMAVKYMHEQQIQQIFDTIWNVENLDDMGRLTRLMVFQPR